MATHRPQRSNASSQGRIHGRKGTHMSFKFFADEVAFCEQTDRQSQMAGVTGPSFLLGSTASVRRGLKPLRLAVREVRRARQTRGGSMKEIIGRLAKYGPLCDESGVVQAWLADGKSIDYMAVPAAPQGKSPAG